MPSWILQVVIVVIKGSRNNSNFLIFQKAFRDLSAKINDVRAQLIRHNFSLGLAETNHLESPKERSLDLLLAAARATERRGEKIGRRD